MNSLQTLLSTLAGIIPGPHEPQLHINTYLKPLVDDLLELWNGVQLVEGECMRAALICITSDIPAMRKVTQFLGHKADFGCPRCKFQAEREPGTTGASGRMSYFTPQNVECRTHDEVVAQAAEYRNAASKSAAASVAQKNGVRSSRVVTFALF